ncbi:MAG TPA: SpoIVB peptidase S55 domain-containing protein [Bryobacteraceae bacterium]|nr:SpoIVB peptidase S55 domain-containing protein [Bryobacteraceae bacterium]
MNVRIGAILLGFAVSVSAVANEPSLVRPKAGKVETMPESQVKPGMKATAWTVFQGTQPEPVPIEIVGILKNQWGPKQDIIVGKMGGKAVRTGVAGGMSGSPVYIDGKLIGAVALRMSVFSPDAICGITPIDLMLEINDYDKSRPEDAKTPDKIPTTPNRQVAVDSPMLQQLVAAGGGGPALGQMPNFVPIETPLTFAGFKESVLRNFGPLFNQLGIAVAQGGAATTGSTLETTKPAPGWQSSLSPGQTVAGVLVDGDMSVSGAGTVTYNDGHRVLAFGHPFFNLGPMDMPMTRGDVILTLASTYQPNKMINATDIVGALHQDRHSGIEGVLGAESHMVPVSMKVRSLGGKEAVEREKDFHFNVFVHQKWTPYLMMLSLYNSLSELNDLSDEGTYRLAGTVEMNGGQKGLELSNMQSSGEMMPAPMALAGWFGDKFNKLYLNNLAAPDVKRVNVTVDLIPERRVATIDNAWVGDADVRPGDTVPMKVFLRPYRGEMLERDFTVKVPAGLTKGEHRILLSDADTLNRMQNIAGIVNHYLNIPETVSLINQERTNNRLYVSLVESSPTAYVDDKTLPSLPSSVLNVMQAGRAPTRTVLTSPDTATEETSLPFDYVVNGSYTLRLHVK